jgi:hypothetical protein
VTSLAGIALLRKHALTELFPEKSFSRAVSSGVDMVIVVLRWTSKYECVSPVVGSDLFRLVGSFVLLWLLSSFLLAALLDNPRPPLSFLLRAARILSIGKPVAFGLES